MSKGVRQRFLWVGLAAAVFALVMPSLASRAGAQTTKVRLGVPSADVMVGGASFNIDVVVEDVTNLGAFQFTLLYDSTVLGGISVEQGPFLASSGRTVQCLDPKTSPGSMHFVCVTLGATPPGANGSGVLATITLAPNAPGTSPLQIQEAALVRPDGQTIPAASEDASITVTSPGAPETPSPAGTAPAPTVAQGSPVTTPTPLTPTEPTSIRPTATRAGTPATAVASGGGGMNWPLWGSIIGAAAVLLAASAGLFWWSRARTPS